MPGKRFLIWRAVSSKKQAEEVSPHVQEEMARQHVAKWGGSVVDVLDVAESRDIAIVSDAAIARHQQGLRRADTAFVNGAMDEERYREQVTRLRTAIEAEQSTKTVLQAQADAATQRGSRAEMLAEVAAAGPAMLTLDDAAAANAWFRRYVRVFVRGNEVVEVRFDFW